MKANNEDFCRANVFLKMRTTNNRTIRDEVTRIVVVSILITYHLCYIT